MKNTTKEKILVNNNKQESLSLDTDQGKTSDVRQPT